MQILLRCPLPSPHHAERAAVIVVAALLCDSEDCPGFIVLNEVSSLPEAQQNPVQDGKAMKTQKHVSEKYFTQVRLTGQETNLISAQDKRLLTYLCMQMQIQT